MGDDGLEVLLSRVGAEDVRQHVTACGFLQSDALLVANFEDRTREQMDLDAKYIYHRRIRKVALLDRISSHFKQNPYLY